MVDDILTQENVREWLEGSMSSVNITISAVGTPYSSATISEPDAEGLYNAGQNTTFLGDVNQSQISVVLGPNYDGEFVMETDVDILFVLPQAYQYTTIMPWEDVVEGYYANADIPDDLKSEPQLMGFLVQEAGEEMFDDFAEDLLNRAETDPEFAGELAQAVREHQLGEHRPVARPETGPTQDSFNRSIKISDADEADAVATQSFDDFVPS